MILNFKNGQGVERDIGQPNSYKETCEMIDKFLDKHNFKSYYTRIWKDNGKYVFDVGSHSEFFILDICGEVIEELEGL